MGVSADAEFGSYVVELQILWELELGVQNWSLFLGPPSGRRSAMAWLFCECDTELKKACSGV